MPRTYNDPTDQSFRYTFCQCDAGWWGPDCGNADPKNVHYGDFLNREVVREPFCGNVRRVLREAERGVGVGMGVDGFVGSEG